MRAVTLSGGKAGISRQRIKGGASQDTFYDLLNCHRTASQTIIPRPGSRRAVTVAGTVGMTVFDGKFVVFAGSPTPSPDPSVVVEVLTHPTGDTLATLIKVVYAKPFLGFLYVVASWSDAPTVFYHYWLQRFDEGRKPFAFIRPGEIVQPTNPDGFGYIADRFGRPNPVWKPGQVKAVGDLADPTEFVGYSLEVVDTFGTNPATGTAEPNWPAIYDVLNAVAIEEAGSTPTTIGGPVVTTQGPGIGIGTGSRYGNMGGWDQRRIGSETP